MGYICNSDDMPQFFWYEEERVMLDECGDIIDDIHSLFHTSLMYLLRTNKKDMVVYTKQGRLVELVYMYGYVDMLYMDRHEISKLYRRL